MGIRSKIAFYRRVNWYKTFYFNFKKFPFSVAKKLPIFFYGPVKFTNISGDFIINAPVKKGMIGFGKRFEQFTVPKGTAEFNIQGKVIFNGYCIFGKDYFLSVAKGAILQVGNRSGMGSDCKLVCMERIIVGNDVRISYETQVMDSNFHYLVDTLSGERFEMNKPIQLGNNIFIGNRSSILPGTVIADYCVVASNSVCNKDYSGFGAKILIGGIPAKLLKTDISRDWEGEDNEGFWEGI